MRKNQHMKKHPIVLAEIDKLDSILLEMQWFTDRDLTYIQGENRQTQQYIEQLEQENNMLKTVISTLRKKWKKT